MTVRATDAVAFALGAVRAQRMRSVLTGLGIAVGVATVVLLTALGEGLHRFVLAEFTQFGTNLLAVTPGRTTTHGLSGAVLNTLRPLTLADADALREVHGVEAVSSVVQGNAELEWQHRSRRIAVYGVSAAMPSVWRFGVATGRFLPDEPGETARSLAVLGSKARKELFGTESPLGAVVHIGGDRFRVVGVLEPKGELLGFDLDDAVYVPTARALRMYDRDGVMEIDLLLHDASSTQMVTDRVRDLLLRRHGMEDFTITSQQQMLDVLGSVLSVLTLAVGALGGISLVVGGIGIFTIMTVALRERTAEIGLLRALGATRRQVGTLFLQEAALLAGAGGLAGLVGGSVLALGVGILVPALPVAISPLHAALAEAVAIGTGLIAGVVPALRSARLRPVEALRAE